jgi:acetyl esterase/lipase
MTSPLRIVGLLAVVVAASLALAACSPLGTLNALSSSRTHTLTADVAYGDNPRQKLDIYTPTSAAPAGGWPVVVFFYGGTWDTGKKKDYEFVGEAMASRGVLTIVADYRLYPEVRYPDFLKDSASALAYGLEKAASLGGNSKRVFVMGHSAGGYNAAMVALDARWLKDTGHSPKELAGWIGLAGPYDFYPIENPDAKPVFFHPNYPPNSQPIDYALPGSPRTFLGAAKKDDLVNPQRNTVGLATRLQAADVPVRVRLYEHVNHMTLIGVFAQPLRWLAPALKDVATFVNAEAPI